MSFSALAAALLLEYFRPLGARFRVYAWFSAYARFLERLFNAGGHRHGVLAWLLGCLPLAAVAGLCGYWLARFNPVLGLAWNAGLLYFVMGFKEFGARAGEIAALLRKLELDEAGRQLGQWTGRPPAAVSETEVARLAILETLKRGFEELLGVIVWFVVFGSGGAVLYRLAQVLSAKWGSLEVAEYGEFGAFATRAAAWIEWVPLRLTAIGFAVVGDFEDAVYCWRTQAGGWQAPDLGIVLSSGAGALGVVLSGGPSGAGPDLGMGEEADADFLESAVSMVWRVLAMWLALLLLLTLARWSGS